MTQWADMTEAERKAANPQRFQRVERLHLAKLKEWLFLLESEQARRILTTTDEAEFTAALKWAISELLTVTREREAWEAGFRLAVSYGDNYIHFDGEQKERQWQSFLAATPSARPADTPTPSKFEGEVLGPLETWAKFPDGARTKCPRGLVARLCAAYRQAAPLPPAVAPAQTQTESDSEPRTHDCYWCDGSGQPCPYASAAPLPPAVAPLELVPAKPGHRIVLDSLSPFEWHYEPVEPV